MSLLTRLAALAVLTVAASAVAETPRGGAIAARPTSCTIASSSIAGTWSCFRTPSVGNFSNVVYKIAQSGNRFYNVGETSEKIFGRIEGTALDLSEVVGGEELEGYVLRAEGHLIPVNGVANRGIVTVYHTSQGGIGSFNCQKQ